MPGIRAADGVATKVRARLLEIELGKNPLRLGSALACDAVAEKFTAGEHSEAARRLAAPAYRETFAMPEEI